MTPDPTPYPGDPTSETHPHTVITPRGVPLEPGTTFVLPLGVSLPTATPVPAGLQAGSKAPASAPLPDRLPDASPRELLYVGGEKRPRG